MFELAALSPARRGPLVMSALIHATLGGALAARQLWTVEEPPEVERAEIVFQPNVPRDRAEPVHLDLQRTPARRTAGGGAPRPASAPHAPAAQPQFQPTQVGDLPASPQAAFADHPMTDVSSGSWESGQDGEDHSGADTGDCPDCPGDIRYPGPGVTEPVAIYTPEPLYPELLRRTHIQGIVVLKAVIASDGAVHDVEVLHAVNPLLDQAAVEGVLRWRYAPALVAGRPVAVYLTVTVHFALN